MEIRAQIRATQPAPQPQPQPKPKKEDWWHELTSGELLTAGLKLSPQKLGDAVSASKDIGKAIGNVWDDLRKELDKVFHLPVVEHQIDPAEREKLTRILVDVASVVGYAAAGVEGVAGIFKLKKSKTTSDRLEGLMDIAAAGAIATTIASAGVAPLVLGPLAAVLGSARGTINGVAGFRHGQSRQEVQGFLDGTRSTGTLCGLLGRYAGVLATAGAVLGPIAGAIQMTRGYVDLETGLKTADKSKELEGLSDIGAAAGLILMATGAGLIPGLVVTVLAVGAKVLYPLNHKLHARIDRGLEKIQPALTGATHGIDRVADPVLEVGRKVIARLTGWHHGDEPPPPPTSGSAGPGQS